MLKDFVEKNLYCFHDKFDTWEESIRASCKPLVDAGICDLTYQEAIIDCVNKYGPYIVIMPNIALPHSQESASGVYGTAISFMKVNQPVVFDKNDPLKNAQLFFVLASNDHNTHLDNIAKLSELLTNDELVLELLSASSKEDLLIIHDKFLA